MHGNVAQWCADAVDPEGTFRVIRGSCFIDMGFNCRAAKRGRLEATARNNQLGFRLVRVPSGGK
jgi:formylglycine-generating enzyme required for sulfatase activity